MSDPVELNEDGDWLGPDYALGLVDEVVLSDCTAHFEMSSDSSGYLAITSPTRSVFVRLHARPTSRAERRQVLAHNQGTLRDHLAALIPSWLGGRTEWSIPVHRRPWAAVSEWWDDRRAAGAVLMAELEEDEETT